MTTATHNCTYGEGVDQMEDRRRDQMSAEHDSETCDAANGNPCPMCVFANEQEERELAAQTKELLPVILRGLQVERAIAETQDQIREGTFDQSAREADDQIAAATAFEQAWESAPRSLCEHAELRAILLDVIDRGCNCDPDDQLRHAPWTFDDEDEDFANRQRVSFADEVIRRFANCAKQRDAYWFEQGRRAGRE